MPERFPSVYVLFCLLQQVAIGVSSLAFKGLDVTIKISFIEIIQCIQFIISY